MGKDELDKLRIDKPSARSGLRQQRRRTLAVVGSMVLIVIAVLVGYGVFTPSVDVEVTTASLVYPSQTFTRLNASGYVVAQRRAQVASKATGRLDWLGVEEGSRVKKGDIIARLANRDVEAARDQAAAALVSARAALEGGKADLKDVSLNYERTKDLYQQGIVSRSTFDSSEAAFLKAQASVEKFRSMINESRAALQVAQVNVEHTLISAPFDGVVLTKNADIGDIVTPLGAAANAKAAVVTLADLTSLMIEADVSEANLGKVVIGQPCEILLDALPDARFRGEVHTVVPTADRTKAAVMVKVRFIGLDRRVLPEMSAKVAFLERTVRADEQSPRTALTPAAIIQRAGHNYVYKVAGDRAVETEVGLGTRSGDLQEIVSGIKPGEKVVLKPLDRIKNSNKIKILSP